MDSAPDRANSTVTLRDGRPVTLRELDSQDEREVARLLRSCSDARERFFARAAQLREAQPAATGIAAAAFVACSAEGDRVVGYVAYVADDARDGELAGVVDPAFAGNGLGTALVRRAAAHARENGLELLRIELHPGPSDRNDDPRLGAAESLGSGLSGREGGDHARADAAGLVYALGRRAGRVAGALRSAPTHQNYTL